jgi:hypothetical protein
LSSGSSGDRRTAPIDPNARLLAQFRGDARKPYSVIPGRREAPNPESITAIELANPPGFRVPASPAPE